MFCEKCGKKIEDGHSFCIFCGNKGDEGDVEAKIKNINTSNEKWWQRLFMVMYITLYTPLLLIIPSSFIEFMPKYFYGSGRYDSLGSSSGSYSAAFFYCFLSSFGYIIFLRFSKLLILYVLKYITKGERMSIKKELFKWY